MSRSAYLVVLERFHQLCCVGEGHGEGEVRPAVDIRNLNALVAEVSLPLHVATNVVFAEDVRDEIS